ncbi:chitin synthase-domain-containing protein [Boletus edulis BED1]|uniref:Chitin synthase-domain-containing protein n=1 Tax=Boletus edulis BED1 TaxID=1328754 RepID=A0AAD4GLL3_BOLED|nr:chitin synthase-domain-containing protein [Boletus edulis BED1]
MVSIIAFKFIASINFGPYYTKGETSLRCIIDLLAQLEYDDKRKLILVVCDGNIVGSGNDRLTPHIVLDILGVDPNLDPEPPMKIKNRDSLKKTGLMLCERVL